MSVARSKILFLGTSEERTLDKPHIEILRQGVDIWNAWRTKEPLNARKTKELLIEPDLFGARYGAQKFGGAYCYSIRGPNLRDSDLHGADLRGANLRGTDLRGANLSGADLRDANLNYAWLFEADLRGADLRGAQLTRGNLGNLTGAKLYETHLNEADLSFSDLFAAQLGGANLHPLKANRNKPKLQSAALAVSSGNFRPFQSATDIAKSLEDEHLPFNAAVFAAQISALVYLPCKPVLAALEAEGCAHGKFFNCFETQAVGFVYAGYAFLVFRGTEPGSLEDWGTDLRLWPRGGRPRRHIGFFTAWERVRPQVESWLTALDLEPKRLVLSGHSLGGALAILAAFDLADSAPIQAVLTFGAPRVGGRRFRRAYHQTPASPLKKEYRHLQDVTWRFIHETDLVTMIPPPLFYHHVGQPRPTVGYSRSAVSQRIEGIGTMFDGGLPQLPQFPQSTIASFYSSQSLAEHARQQSSPIDFFVNMLLGILVSILPRGLQVHVPLVTRLLRMLALSASAHPAKDYVIALERELSAKWYASGSIL
jgi:uncharacterized protein YjbI with pentapeptide repeats/pimeloyl-ACP methyl ester carboxylesterase